MQSSRPVSSLTAVALMFLLAQGCSGGASSPPGPGGPGGSGGQGGGSPAGTGGSAGSGGSGGATSAPGGEGGGVDAGAAPEAGGSPGKDDGSAPPDGPGPGSDAGPASTIPIAGLGAWTGKDNVPPSPSPPGNLDPKRVPMFVSLGFDDNPENEGVNWAVGVFSGLKNPAGTGKAATFDGTTTRATFYNSSIYTAAASSWKAAHAAGFETGDHTIHHYHGAAADSGMNFTQAGWTAEIQGCINFLTGAAVGAKRDEIYGFRTPYLQYNVNVFPALKALSFWYDCSIQEGHQPDQDGTNFLWPYTLDKGSPGHASHPKLEPITSWPAGLWEMPAYRVIVPPDADAQKYGVPPGLRAKLTKLHPDYFSEAAPKITGLDYNLWYDFRLNKAEFVATVKHSLDLRLRGNRAPMLFGMHSAIYSAVTEPVPSAALAERRQAIVDFLKYALTFPDVRVVTTKAVLDWIRNPVPLD
jgi:hypothetical protein